jgi:hypothetical protein
MKKSRMMKDKNYEKFIQRLKKDYTLVEKIKDECESRIDKLDRERKKLLKQKSVYDNKFHLSSVEAKKLKQIENEINELEMLRYNAIVKCNESKNVINVSTIINQSPQPPEKVDCEKCKKDKIKSGVCSNCIFENDISSDNVNSGSDDEDPKNEDVVSKYLEMKKKAKEEDISRMNQIYSQGENEREKEYNLKKAFKEKKEKVKKEGINLLKGIISGQTPVKENLDKVKKEITVSEERDKKYLEELEKRIDRSVELNKLILLSNIENETNIDIEREKEETANVIKQIKTFYNTHKDSKTPLKPLKNLDILNYTEQQLDKKIKKEPVDDRSKIENKYSSLKSYEYGDMDLLKYLSPSRQGTDSKIKTDELSELPRKLFPPGGGTPGGII